MSITGLHHITLGCNDAQRTIDFYTQVLGLRMIKLTVNFDDPGTYHLYFGDEAGTPGTAITFFEWPNAGKGRPGIGGTHHFALQVATLDGLLQWKRRLVDLGLQVTGPLNRKYFTSIYFNDPDGTILEIATIGPGWTVDEPAESLGEYFQVPPKEHVITGRDETEIEALTWFEPVDRISPEMSLHGGMHHITLISSDIQRSHEYYSGLLGLRRLKMTSNFDDPDSQHWYWGVGDGQPGTVVTAFERDLSVESRMRMGAGQTHHFAFSVPNAEIQLEWRHKLIEAGLNVSPVMDRVYFQSIYTRDPDGHIIELATAGPGFAADESVAELGSKLQLPPWYEPHRADIEAVLKPVIVREALEVG
jgi:glyoxalase family protein